MMSFCREQSKLGELSFSRRRFIKWGALAAITCVTPCSSLAAARKPRSYDRQLSFYNLHTGESRKIFYWANGHYVQEALNEINLVLRDHRTNEVKPIDTGLLDLLYAIRKKVRTSHAFHVISGYRSPETNSFLRQNHTGVAKNSLHMYGKAIDIRLPGTRLTNLRRVAMTLKQGGVGYYPESEFVHVDVGQLRYW